MIPCLCLCLCAGYLKTLLTDLNQILGMIDLRSRTNRLHFGTDANAWIAYRINFSISPTWIYRVFYILNSITQKVVNECFMKFVGGRPSDKEHSIRVWD